MTKPFRLTTGGSIDRTKPLLFTFNGKPIEGFVGDTVASAVLANGIRLFGRSFKYHRPRGLLSHGSDEPNALLEIEYGRGRIDPNNRATVIDASDGLRARSQNHWPTLRFDLGAVNNLLSPILSAGFYYKTFMWPRSFWDKVYEPCIRATAGLGRAPIDPDADRYVHRYAHYDVLIVGGGPAGLSAALAASKNGRKVVIADEQAEFGGSLLHDRITRIEELNARSWIAKTIDLLRSRENVTLLQRTTAFGYYNHNHIGLIERVASNPEGRSVHSPRERLWQVRARQVVLATGAHERPLVFANNDRPGIMLAESIRVFVNRYAVAPGKRIIFITADASAYRAAMDVHEAGIDVSMVDIRPEDARGPEVAVARERGIGVLTNHAVIDSRGKMAVTGIVVAAINDDGTVGRTSTLPCDCVGMSGGWTPAVHLFSQSRGKLSFRDDINAFVPGMAAQPVSSAGAANGTYDTAGCVAEGWRLGLSAVGEPRPDVFGFALTSSDSASTQVRQPAATAERAMAFVDFQNDVTARDIRLAIREGFESIEHIKRYTTTGMATDQGKTSNMTALRIASYASGRSIPHIGTTTFRPPYTPVTFGTLAGSSRGELFDPVRKTPLHDWAERQGAVFENVGLWRRARYFPHTGESMHAAVARESRAVRTVAGIFDASTLGKIEVVGPDAAEFMNRIYINTWSKLEPGKCRYGVMLKEDGYILDDGVVARLAADRFHVTTTTGGASRVLAHMEDYLQTEWPDLNVFLTSITEQWAVIAVQGPAAQSIIAPLVQDIDLSSVSFPHMSIRCGRICGVPTRLFRVSFTGELGYEINVPSDYAQSVWDAIIAHGATAGITPYGTETMHVLRAERGFIIVGQETDGTVTPDDVGLAGMIGKTKRDFVGKRSLDRPDLAKPDRKQLVGLITETAALVLDEGAQIVADPVAPMPMQSLGHVSSSYWSEVSGRSIALALVAGGRARKEQTLYATTPKGFAPVRVVEPVFVDREGRRAHV